MTDLAQALVLLTVSKCPNCNGSGAVPVLVCARHYATREMALDAGDPSLEGSLVSDEEWETERCQWCHERHELLKKYENYS
jgi:hypothetical protein